MLGRGRSVFALVVVWLALFGITAAVAGVMRSEERATLFRASGTDVRSRTPTDPDSADARADLEAQPRRTNAVPIRDLVMRSDFVRSINEILTNDIQRQRLRECKSDAMSLSNRPVEYFEVSFRLSEESNLYWLRDIEIERASFHLPTTGEACILRAFLDVGGISPPNPPALDAGASTNARISVPYCFSQQLVGIAGIPTQAMEK